MKNLIVETSGLTKIFDSERVIDGLNIRMEEGSIYGFVGLNGAGKTTTIKLLLGLIKPSEGNISIFGQELLSNKTEILRQVGSMMESSSTYRNLSGRDNLRFAARLLKIPMNRVDECLEIVELTSEADKQVRNYSLGMKQRLGIAMALLNKPQLVVLDEPTNGLDPVGIVEMRKFIKELPQKWGVSVFISSHLLSEINLTATHVGIIHKGRLAYQGTLKDLKKHNQNRFCIKLSERFFIDRDASSLTLNASKGEVGSSQELKLNTTTGFEMAYIREKLAQGGIEIIEIVPVEETLEDIFLRYTQSNSENT